MQVRSLHGRVNLVHVLILTRALSTPPVLTGLSHQLYIHLHDLVIAGRRAAELVEYAGCG